MRSAVTAHRAQIQVCPACGRAHQGPLPAAVTHAVPYGPTGHTWASSLTKQPPMPVERTPAIGADVGPHRGSAATGVKAAEPWGRGMEPSTEAVQGRWRHAEGRPGEASGRRVTGQWPGRHVAGTERLTSSAVHATRGHEAMEDAGMLGAFRGPAGHDPGKPSLK